MKQNPHEQNSMQSSAAAIGTSSQVCNEATIEEYFKSFPPGYRFAPTDEELLEDYLMKKVNKEPLPPNLIREVNLYSKDPTELIGSNHTSVSSLYFPHEKLVDKPSYQNRGRPNQSVQNEPITEAEWYFFTPREKKYPNGSRPKRSTPNGYWKPTGTDKAVPHGSEHPVGYKKTLDFYEGRHPGGTKTDWKMHEYKVKDSNSQNNPKRKDDMKLDDWVLCKIYMKRQKNGGDEEESNGDGTQPTTVIAQNNDASSMVGTNNEFEDQKSNVNSQPIVNVNSQENEASMMGGNNNIRFEDQNWNANSQPIVNVNSQKYRASMMAGNNNIGFQDQKSNANSQPTVNVNSQENGASRMAGNNNIKFEDQNWNANSQPIVNVNSQEYRASMVAGNNNIGFEDQKSNANSQPTVNVNSQENGASRMTGNNNIKFEDQNWNAFQSTLNVAQNNEASSLVGNNKFEFEGQNSNASQPTLNVARNNEASSMAENNKFEFEGQNLNASPPFPYPELGTVESYFMVSQPVNQDEDQSDIWEDFDFSLFDVPSSEKKK